MMDTSTSVGESSASLSNSLSAANLQKSSTSVPVVNTNVDLSHSVKESYHCPQCSFSTAWKSSLSIHLKTHTNERPWQCALCNKHFKLKHHLKHHILTHSSSKPFKCNLCNYKTADSRNIQRHKFNKHRTTFLKRRGAEKLSLPTMVPGSHGTFTGMNPFVDQGISFSQGITSSTPLSTPSFQGSLSSPIFQSSPAYSLANGTTWIQKTKDTQAKIIQSIAENTFGDMQESSKSMFFASLNDSSPDSIPITVKEESDDVVYSKRKSISDFQFEPPSVSTQDDLSILNVSGAGGPMPKFVQIESDSNDSIMQKEISEKASGKVRIKNDEKWMCLHCKIVFPDNIMYGLHMGCHSVSNVFQCNICGVTCNDKHDFMFHFTIGKHEK